MFCVTLDPAAPRGRELMLRLLQRAEIWMESSAPGACEKIGLGDADVLKACPRLVIAHVSGFGRDAVRRSVPAITIRSPRPSAA